MLHTIFLFLVCACAQAHQFIYLKSNEVNVRAGPGSNHRIKMVISSKREPVIELARFDSWVKIRDLDGLEGWVREAMTSKRAVGAIVTEPAVFVRILPTIKSRRLAKLERGVRMVVLKCKRDWCKVKVDRIKGWCPRKALWGLNRAVDG